MEVEVRAAGLTIVDPWGDPVTTSDDSTSTQYIGHESDMYSAVLSLSFHVREFRGLNLQLGEEY